MCCHVRRSQWSQSMCDDALRILKVTVCAGVLDHFSRVRFFATLWTVARQAPLSMGFSGQGYGKGLPRPPPEGVGLRYFYLVLGTKQHARHGWGLTQKVELFTKIVICLTIAERRGRRARKFS